VFGWKVEVNNKGLVLGMFGFNQHNFKSAVTFGGKAACFGAEIVGLPFAPPRSHCEKHDVKVGGAVLGAASKKMYIGTAFRAASRNLGKP
jgi:hypothetical protein